MQGCASALGLCRPAIGGGGGRRKATAAQQRRIRAQREKALAPAEQASSSSPGSPNGEEEAAVAGAAAGAAAAAAAAGVSSAPAPAKTAPALQQLEGVSVKSIADGSAVDLQALITSSFSPACPKVILVLLTNFADFDAWEAAQQIASIAGELELRQAKPVLVGIGSVEAAQAFQEMLQIPSDVVILADDAAGAHKALNLEPGLQSPEELKTVLNPYARLVAMCAGVGSPGTLAEVFRGYLGDSKAEQIFNNAKISAPRPVDWAGAFDIVGTGFQRPFELATLRLLNMTDILQNWSKLSPKDPELLLQRGGTFIFEKAPSGDIEARLEFRDQGLLGFARKEDIFKAVS